MRDRAHRPGDPSRHRCAVLALLGVLAGGCGAAVPPEPSPLEAPSATVVRDASRAVAPRAGPSEPRRALQLHGLRVLRHWDARRARAYAAADPDALRRLYVPGSVAGTRDRALLARYAARGLRVRGVHPQISRIEATATRRGVLSLRVVERYPELRVVGERRGRRAAAPVRDGYTSRELTLRHGADGWQVVAVRPG